MSSAHASDVSDLTSFPRHTPIVGGEPTEPGEHGSVVAVLAHEGLCTGIIVSKSVVLTAGHCLAGLELGEDLSVFWGDDLDQSRRVSASRWGVHPEFCPDCKEDIYDFGYVVIDGEFLGDDFLAPIVTQDEWDATMRKGQEVVLVGYGEDPDVGGVTKGLGIKRSVTTEISRFSAKGLEFYAGGSDRDSCQGDSGGPAFVHLQDGAMRLAGITSRGSNPCGKGGYYGTPYAALCWLDEETGVNLRGDECSGCDCLDTSPPPDDEGCAFDRPAPGSPGLMWLLLPLGLIRRR